MDSQRTPNMLQSSKCVVLLITFASILYHVSGTPAPVGGISNVEFNIYPVGSARNHQTLHSSSFSNKLKVNYDVKHPPNPNPVVHRFDNRRGSGFRSQQNHYTPPAQRYEPPVQQDWRRQDQHQNQQQQHQNHQWEQQHHQQQHQQQNHHQPESQPQPQNWFVPDHVPQHERPTADETSQFGFRREHKRPRPIFLDEVQQWEDPNISSHRRWKEERQAVLGPAARSVHLPPKQVQRNLMTALDESAPLEYF